MVSKLKEFFMNGGAYVMVVLGILLAKGIGFLRDIVFASVFGATVYTDMYFQVFGLVNLIFTGIGVALSTLVIKNLNKPALSGENEKRLYVSRFITKTTFFVLCASLALFVFERPVVRILLPGLSEKDTLLALKLMHIMLPSFLFVIIAYIISGVLQNCGVFFISSVMSLPFNVVIITSLFVKDIDIVKVGIVTTVGWFLHIAVQLPSFYKKGYRLFSADIRKKDGGGSIEIVYIFISNMMFQLCFMSDKAAVSAQSGAGTTINYASNLFITISSVFVVAMSNVVFPSISKNYEEGNLGYVRKLIKYIITVMAAIFVPFILTVCCFGENIIALLYERGEFGPELTHITALLFAIYTLGALGYVCQELFNKVLYLDSKYGYTVIGTLAVVALKMLVNVFALPLGGAAFVAASTTVLFLAYAVNIAFAISKVIGAFLDKELIGNIARVVAAAICALAVFLVFLIFAPNVLRGRFTFILPLALCGAAYCIVMLLNGGVKTIMSGAGRQNGGKENE